MQIKLTEIVFIVPFVLFTIFAKAQKKSKEYSIPKEHQKLSISGQSIIAKTLNNNGSSLGGKLAMAYQQKKHFYQLQVTSISEVAVFRSNYESVLDIGILYGGVKRKKKWLFNVAAGVSYFSFNNHIIRNGGLFSSPSSQAYYETTRQAAFGIPLQSSVLYQPKKLGIGISFDGNVNRIISYIGGGLLLRYTF